MWKKNLLPIITSIFLICSSLIIGKNAEDSLIKELIIISAIGVDIKDEEFLVTVQAIDAPAVKDSASDKLGYILYQESGRTITEAMQKLHKTFSRYLFMDDIEVILISEELAKKRGIDDVINYLFLEQTISSNILIFVSKAVSANDILATFRPFEKVSSRGIVDTIENIENYASFATPVYPNRVKNLLLNYPVVNNVIPYISLAGDVEEGISKDNIASYQPKTKTEINGMSYFKKDKLIDFLSTEESQHFLFIMDKVREGTLESNCPEGPGYFSYHLKKSKTKYEISWNGNIPKISIKIKPNGRIIESTCKTNFEHPNMDLFRSQIKKQLEASITELIRKSQEEKLDYVGFGKQIYFSDPSKWRKIEGEWESIFPKTLSEVKVDVSITRSGDAISLD
ncbi:Ger(x)C family spore germination protein [Bacillus sp. RO1]|uniref:Ger(x)C family spore germination protein n=1 Tax=Bacillus sp. RO1 TaxID=2722703 RepID=UPI0014579268|nr:Ger(x)C family spore germination protein [Bacillus sp. RO1]NLP50094.1 Ger(x)C family spore germination protein [Bacillus sp. RO1]